jgi:hypothetical protein
MWSGPAVKGENSFLGGIASEAYFRGKLLRRRVLIDRIESSCITRSALPQSARSRSARSGPHSFSMRGRSAMPTKSRALGTQLGNRN